MSKQSCVCIYFFPSYDHYRPAARDRMRGQRTARGCAIKEMASCGPTAAWSLGIPLQTPQFWTLLKEEEEIDQISSICGRLGGRKEVCVV